MSTEALPAYRIALKFRARGRHDMNVQKLLTPQQVAEALGVSTQTLAVWRCEKRYRLPYVKAGRLVRYRKADVDAFIEARLHESG